jgi:glycyl-tRNA synthetase beta chain
MAELLLELFSEEIPARMQSKAADDLKSIITNALVDAGLTYEGAQVHATPRRLVLSVEGLNARSSDSTIEIKGPKTDASMPAIEGFLKKLGCYHPQVSALIAAMKNVGEQWSANGFTVEIKDTAKGSAFFGTHQLQGRAATDVIAEIVPHMVRNFPWPKSMRWGSGTLRWIRPLQSILCTFDGEVVPFEVEGIKSGNTTLGHRFLSSGAIEARRFDDYAGSLHKAHVIVDANARMETIRADAKNLSFAQGLEMIEDEALLKEVAGLVEWPVVLMGSFDKNYLNVPEEVIITTIKNNQKCFCLRGKDGKLSNHYLLVANTIASDGGKTIIHGNNKVIAARLSDAKFFWDQDRKVKLEDLLPKLDAITFHAKLGSQGERVKRIEALAGEIAKSIGADIEKSKLAARLAKADLVTGMVGEFPELQGLMGRYIALEQGIDPEVADALRDHYKPQGPSDSIPVSKIGQAVALADKLDTLVGFWAIEEKPTGSKDPFALRRAALGLIRIVIEKSSKLPLSHILEYATLHILSQYKMGIYPPWIETDEKNENRGERLLVLLARGPISTIFNFDARLTDFVRAADRLSNVENIYEGYEEDKKLEQESAMRWRDISHALSSVQVSLEHYGFFTPTEVIRFSQKGILQSGISQLTLSLLAFFADRLKVYLKDQGARHDLIDAVFALGGQDDLLMVVRRVEALSKFLETDDGKNLLAGVKRAANILRIEEKKDDKKYSGDVNPAQLIKGEEKALHSAISQASALARKAVEHEDFEGAMKAIAKLRVPVDEFFEGVIVNDKDATFRENRLRLLNRIREATAEVADFSKIEG